jgi:methylmalonyl-CoA mutase
MFLSKEGSPFVIPGELVRSTTDDKDRQIANVEAVRGRSTEALEELQKAAIHNGNVFAALMEAAKTASLGEMSDALFEVGGKYRRNM